MSYYVPISLLSVELAAACISASKMQTMRRALRSIDLPKTYPESKLWPKYIKNLMPIVGVWSYKNVKSEFSPWVHVLFLVFQLIFMWSSSNVLISWLDLDGNIGLVVLLGLIESIVLISIFLVFWPVYFASFEKSDGPLSLRFEIIVFVVCTISVFLCVLVLRTAADNISLVFLYVVVASVCDLVLRILLVILIVSCGLENCLVISQGTYVSPKQLGNLLDTSMEAKDPFIRHEESYIDNKPQDVAGDMTLITFRKRSIDTSYPWVIQHSSNLSYSVSSEDDEIVDVNRNAAENLLDFKEVQMCKEQCAHCAKVSEVYQDGGSVTQDFQLSPFEYQEEIPENTANFRLSFGGNPDGINNKPEGDLSENPDENLFSRDMRASLEGNSDEEEKLKLSDRLKLNFANEFDPNSRFSFDKDFEENDFNSKEDAEKSVQNDDPLENPPSYIMKKDYFETFNSCDDSPEKAPNSQNRDSPSYSSPISRDIERLEKFSKLHPVLEEKQDSALNIFKTARPIETSKPPKHLNKDTEGRFSAPAEEDTSNPVNMENEATEKFGSEEISILDHTDEVPKSIIGEMVSCTDWNTTERSELPHIESPQPTDQIIFNFKPFFIMNDDEVEFKEQPLTPSPVESKQFSFEGPPNYSIRSKITEEPVPIHRASSHSFKKRLPPLPQKDTAKIKYASPYMEPLYKMIKPDSAPRRLKSLKSSLQRSSSNRALDSKPEITKSPYLSRIQSSSSLRR